MPCAGSNRETFYQQDVTLPDRGLHYQYSLRCGWACPNQFVFFKYGLGPITVLLAATVFGVSYSTNQLKK